MVHVVPKSAVVNPVGFVKSYFNVSPKATTCGLDLIPRPPFFRSFFGIQQFHLMMRPKV